MYDKVVKEIIKYLPGETSNTDLDEYGTVLLSDYIGAYPSDRIPFLSNGQCVIVNLDATGQPGSHWVAIYHQDKNYVYDSFGRDTASILPLRNYEDADDDAEQHILETNCGARCLAWLFCFERYGKDYAMTI